MTIGQRIARDLFTNGLGETAIRASLFTEHRALGWLSRKEVADRIDEALAREWPDALPETRFSVRVWLDSLEEECCKLTGYSGPGNPPSDEFLLDRLDEATDRQRSEWPPPGHYLVAFTGDGPGRLVAFETEEQRAERLAQNGE